MIEPLLPAVELFKIPVANSDLLEPFQVLLPNSVQDMLAFHLTRKMRSGGCQWKARHQNPMEIMRAIKPYLPVALRSHNVTTDLLFHGNPESCSGVSFHKACDGNRNTLTIIKLKTGTIFGGFSGVPWTTSLHFHSCTAAFMFLISPSGVFRRLPWKNKGGITGLPKLGPAFGENFELLVDRMVLTAKMDKEVFSEFNEGGRCAFIEKLSVTGHANGVIEYYDVYHIR
ncbi:hypothetical protein HDU81_006711 [Chytriomyces hyalinus]|nr:hypothetical protein HDU81_006711 [Chytriomyces hyalinus]